MIDNLLPMPEKLIDAIKPELMATATNIKSINDEDTKIEEILSFINPDDDYNQWISIGMALKSSGYDFEDFDKWSIKGKKYKSKETRYKWDSFAEDGSTTIGTILYYAHSNGWKGRYIAPDDQAEHKTYDELVEDILRLDDNIHPDTMAALITDIAKSALDPLYVEDLFKKLSDKTGSGLATIRKQYNASKKTIAGDAINSDVPLKIAHRTLKEFYSNGKRLLFTSTGFYVYEHTHWQPIKEEELGSRILFLLENSSFDKIGFSGVKNSAIDLLKSKQFVKGDPFNHTDKNKCIINCRNGELWISKKGKVRLKKHKPESFLNYVLDIEYDPEAKCPKFNKAILNVFQKSADPKDMRRHLMEIIGYVIQSNRFISGWYMFYGCGENGKTAIFDTIAHLLPHEFIYADRIGNLETSRFAIGALYGKLLLADDDVDANTKLPDGMMKKLSEKKLLTGEKKFQDTFEFESCVAILLLANNYPLSSDVSHGMIRRAKIVPFAHQFTKKDRDNNLYPYIWENEMSGVLNKAIKGLKRLIKRGEFKEPQDCIDARNEWLSNAHPFMGFVNEKIKKVSTGKKNTPLEQIKREFENWLAHNDIRFHCTSQKLRNLFEGKGYKTRRLNGRIVVNGVILNK